jgi:hypothetical protein
LAAAAAWMKQNPQRKITRYHMARLIGFAWNKAASIGVDIKVFESTCIYPLNCKVVPEYFFSISDTIETVTFMETSPPNMTPICAPSTSGTNSQNVLRILAGPSITTLNTTLPSDTFPEEVTLSRLLKISTAPKPRRKYSVAEKHTFVPTEEANNTEEKRKNQGNKVKEQRKI